jgi:hypothetical protein
MNNLLLNGILRISYAEIKETICYGLGWNYNDIDVEITWSCRIGEHQYYLVPIVCDDNFKTMINFFIQSGLNIMILYVNSRPKFLYVSTFADLSNPVSKGKNNLLSNDLLQMINDTMFDNIFVDQYRFNYSKPGDNEDDDMLDSNMMINVDVDDDVDDEIIPPAPEFRDFFGLILLFLMIDH